MKILISTGNNDKFNRIAKWISHEGFDIHSFNDLDPQTAQFAKLTDEEELEFASMDERALAKVRKPWNILEDYIIVGTDESAYFPWMDVEILDLRKPPLIQQNGKLIYLGAEDRLIGSDLANAYSGMVDKVATDILMEEELNKNSVDELPPYRFMPVDWKFSLVVASKDMNPEIISRWSWRQYITNLKLPTNEPDTGYMIGKISVDVPGGEVGLKGKVQSEEEPRIAINSFLEKYL